MKVKEILEILHSNSKNVSEKEIFGLLDNIGIEDATLDTDIDVNVTKKLSKKYGVELKVVKAKKETKPQVKEKEAKEVNIELKKEQKQPETKKQDTKTADIKAKETKSKVQPAKEEKKLDTNKQDKASNEGNKKANNTKKDYNEVKEVADKFDQPKKENKNPEVEFTRVYDDKYNEYERGEKQYTRIKNVKKKNKNKENRQSNSVEKKIKDNVVYYVPGMTAGDLAELLGVSSGEVVKKLVMLGYMVSISQPIDREVLEFLADDYGFELKDKVTYDITKFEEMVIEDDEESLVARPPIVTIMGHVDHGKTTLLDTIRSSRVASGEAGGITQHIGAYQVTTKGQKITFIDTPGHAAFTEMRARGANVTDIVVLVVAADDGVMPQTREAIDHAVSAKVPIIVAVNKMDKPQANPDRVKQELAALNLIPSEWGGETEFVNISALTGMGVDDLLETILMVSELQNYRANPNRLGIGTVVEAQLTKGRGPVATFLVKNGTIKIGDPVVVGNVFGKIRAMQDETKANLKSAGPSKAVEVTGLEDVPLAGDHFMVFEDEKTAKLVCEERKNRSNQEKNETKAISLAAMFENLDDSNKEINLIIRTDVQGSAEALISSLNKLSVEGVKVNIIRSGAGTITDNDISLAVASKSIIIGFNVRPNSVITKQAAEKGIEIRLYNVIYKLLEDIEAAMKGMLDPVYTEKVTGELEVRKIFKVSKVGTIAGSYVSDGYIARNSEVRLIRDGITVYTGKLSTLRRGSDDVKEVKQGYECGLTIQNYNDIKEGDIIEAFIMEEV